MNRTSTSGAIAVFVLTLAGVSNARAHGIHFHVDLKHPFNPLQVTIGNTHITPSILPIPPAMHVDGGGTIAKVINGTNYVLQLPVEAAVKTTEVAIDVVTWPVRAISSLKNSIDNAITRAKNAVGDVEDRFNKFIEWLETELPIILVWTAAGIFAFIVIAVATGGLLTRLIVSLFSGRKPPVKAKKKPKKIRRVSHRRTS
jgi:hypothetical protein